MGRMEQRHHLVDNGDGWLLSLHQSWDAQRLRPGTRPVLIVPGYGMNSFIFSYHPHGPSLEGALCAAGLEAWRVDLRAQGESQPLGPRHADREGFGLEDLARRDLPAAIAHALAHSRSGAGRVDMIGASLGGSLMFAHAVLEPGHRIGSMVAMGSPVRWVELHPALRLAFSSPLLAGMVRFRGTRRLMELWAPRLARHVPWLLSIYINAGVTDLSAIGEMVKTVEDPSRRINRQIANWVRERDLVLGGVNIAEGLARVDRPLLCVLASHDGIVPRATALFPYERCASRDRRLLEVGDRTLAIAHADLFVSNASQERVFQPIAEWLLQRD